MSIRAAAEIMDLVTQLQEAVEEYFIEDDEKADQADALVTDLVNDLIALEDDDEEEA